MSSHPVHVSKTQLHRNKKAMQMVNDFDPESIAEGLAKIDKELNDVEE